MYKLIVYGKDDVIAEIPYDPLNGIFGEGNVPVPKEVIEWRNTLSEQKHDSVSIRVFTGHECNLQCAYCYQEEERKDSVLRKPVDVHKLCDGIVYAYRQRRKTENATLVLSFIGGEPLLYWERIKKVILDIERRVARLDAHIITNGTLLTGEMARFCAQHDVSIVLSHDGLGQYLRGVDPLEAGRESARALQWLARQRDSEGNFLFCVSCTLTRNNYSAKEIRAWIKERIHIEDVIIADAPACRAQKEGVLDAYSLRESDLQGYFFGILEALATEPPVYYRSYMSMMQSFLQLICDHKPYPDVGPCLARAKDAFAVDWSGNMLRCHGQNPESVFRCGSINKVGNLLEWYSKELSLEETRAQMADGAVQSTLDTPECRSCPMITACHGACPMLDEAGWRNHCSARYTQALAVFTAVLKMIWPDMEEFRFEPCD